MMRHLKPTIRHVAGMAILVAASSIGAVMPAAVAAEPTVIVLTQVPCQFLESESGTDRGYKSREAKDCEAINARTGKERLAAAPPLVLKPGKYVFRIANKNVPYELGFWLRESGYQLGNPIHKLTKISVSGGGIFEGQSQDYPVELKPGEYEYSCPLNPTPDYRLIVAN